MTFIEDLAKDVKATRAMIDDASAIVAESERSAVVEVDNATSQTLRRANDNLKHGGWGKLPADVIGAGSSDAFSSKSGDGAIGVGTEVIREYTIGDNGTIFHIRWDVPFWGTNECNCNINGPSSDFYEAASIIAAGNKPAAARFVIAEKAAANPVDADWRHCGLCKSLFYSLDNGVCSGHVILIGATLGSGGLPHPVTRSGPHQAEGWKLGVPYLGDTGHMGPHREPDWRRCSGCKLLFYGGWNDAKGVCQGNGDHGHTAEQGGPSYILMHDTPARPGQQNDWRFCTKCYVLFFWPFAADSNCSAGGTHHPDAENYIVNVV